MIFQLDVDTGTYHYEKMLELIPESMKKIAYRMGKDCIHFKGEEGDDLCQVSYDLHKCWQQTDPEVLQWFHYGQNKSKVLKKIQVLDFQ